MSATSSAARLLLAGLLLAGCTAPPERPGVTSSPTQPVAAEPSPPAPAPALPDYAALRVSLAATGDIMLGSDFPEDRLAPDDGAGYLAGATALLQSADYAFGNLEGVLMSGGEPVKECKNPAACYLFRSPPRYARHLSAAGYDLMSLANNHALDFGEEGRDASMAALDAVGIRHSGREGEVASWQAGELRFALIAFSPTRNSWPLLSIDIAELAVAELAASHDIVIVSFHGGSEGAEGSERLAFGMEYAYGEKRGDVVDFAHRVIDAGADIVIGHGPHVPRAMELYNERLIAYSLGNFATYFGIGVSGARGYAPLLIAELDGTGRFIGGRLHSLLQVRPTGPRPDPEQHALNMIRELTALDFPDGELVIRPDGTLSRRAAP